MRSLFLIPVVFGLNAFAALIHTEFPSLLVPIDAREPDRAFGTQFTGNVQHAVHTEVNFDVDANEATYCKLGFYINTDKSLNFPWSVWGEPPFRFVVAELAPAINKDTDTWNSHPQPLGNITTIELSYSGAVTQWGGEVPCKKGQVAQYVLFPETSSRDFGLTWYEIDNPMHGITYEMYA